MSLSEKLAHILAEGKRKFLPKARLKIFSPGVRQTKATWGQEAYARKKS